ncbi:MAG: CRISPR-associated endonuclease Cas1 [Candidatus Eremiobacteraeota bacterium]|nr:CRISPR-associated endonuclease Cas1 [Bryobacterales bacterium]MBV9699867.1 CRISPR-associated endonuclease Cas1 [Candidatus Eremiobacteraeota bacterium]
MNERVLVLEGYDARMYVERGHLVTRDGFANEGKIREIRFPRGRCAVERIVVRAPGGTISMEAVDWCARMGIALSFLGSDGTLLNCLVPDAPHDGPVKRAQAISAVTEDALELARYLLGKKMDAQVHAIEKDFSRLEIGNSCGRSTATAQIHACKESLMRTITLVDFLALEGRAAQVYWDLLVGTPLPWKPWAMKRIPLHWAAISPRTSGKRERVRDATDPFNAVLNYCYTLLEVETRIACEAVGLDPDLGLLHTDDRLRESFVYDLLEPLRSKSDVWALELLRKEQMHPAIFHELRDGVVRLDPDLAALLASALMPRFRTAALEIADEYAKQLRRIAVPRRLVREAPKPIKQRRESWERSSCGYCKEPLPRKGLKFCGRDCYLRYSVEVAKPIEKAHARLAQMRAGGLDPGHGGEAARKRGAALAENNRRRVTGRAASRIGIKAP